MKKNIVTRHTAIKLSNSPLVEWLVQYLESIDKEKEESKKPKKLNPVVKAEFDLLKLYIHECFSRNQEISLNKGTTERLAKEIVRQMSAKAFAAEYVADIQRLARARDNIKK